MSPTHSLRSSDTLSLTYHLALWYITWPSCYVYARPSQAAGFWKMSIWRCQNSQAQAADHIGHFQWQCHYLWYIRCLQMLSRVTSCCYSYQRTLPII